MATGSQVMVEYKLREFSMDLICSSAVVVVGRGGGRGEGGRNGLDCFCPQREVSLIPPALLGGLLCMHKCGPHTQWQSHSYSNFIA